MTTLSLSLYRVTTHDCRPPIRGGDPIFDGTTPFVLPRVHLDRTSTHCAPGWRWVETPQEALRIAGLWPDGRPSRLWRGEVDPADLHLAGGKPRSATGTIVEEAEISDAILADLHRPMAGDGLPVEAIVAEGLSAVVLVPLAELDLRLDNPTGRAHAAWWLAAQVKYWPDEPVYATAAWRRLPRRQRGVGIAGWAWGIAPTHWWPDSHEAVAHLDPDDPRTLPDGTRIVDVEALRAVCMYVSTPCEK